MKKTSKLKSFFATILTATLLFALTACNSDKNAETQDNGSSSGEKKTIAVVAKGESHAFWQSVKSGAEDAAKKIRLLSNIPRTCQRKCQRHPLTTGNGSNGTFK